MGQRYRCTSPALADPFWFPRVHEVQERARRRDRRLHNLSEKPFTHMTIAKPMRTFRPTTGGSRSRTPRRGGAAPERRVDRTAHTPRRAAPREARAPRSRSPRGPGGERFASKLHMGEIFLHMACRLEMPWRDAPGLHQYAFPTQRRHPVVAGCCAALCAGRSCGGSRVPLCGTPPGAAPPAQLFGIAQEVPQERPAAVSADALPRPS